MVVTPVGWALVPLAIIAALVPFASVLALVQARSPRRSSCEHLLAASLVFVLGLYGEIRLLSLAPIDRPLDWLPLVHVALTGVVTLVSVRVRGAWQASWARLAGALRPWLRAIGPLGCMGVAALLLLGTLYLAFGLYSVPIQWDELDYHVPMAVQPHHDGRIGPVGGPLPALHFYPRGSELIWFWTLSLSGSDVLFHAVQFAFGVQLLLAMYLLARRSGARPGAAVLAGVVLASTPIFFLLTTSGYVDIAHAASAVAVLAFLAPTGRSEPVTADWHWAGLAFAEACIVKHPFIAVILAAAALVHALGRRPWRDALVSAIRFPFTGRGLITVCVVAACAHVYIDHWIRYANPCYPFRIVIAGLEIFSAPHTPGPVNSGGQSTASKPISAMSFIERYYYAWTDFNAPLTIESFGSFGPVLPFGLLLPAGAAGVAALLRRQGWPAALCIGVLISMYLTPAAVPRYGIAIVAVIMVQGFCLLSELPQKALTGYASLLLVLCVPNVRQVGGSLEWWLRLARDEGGISLTRRNTSFVEKYDVGAPWTCSRPVIRFVRDNCRAGDVLVWNVSTFPTLLLNREWSNRLVYLPGANGLAWPGPAPGPTRYVPPQPEQLEQWVSELQRIAPRHVLLYEQQAYARHLLEHPELGYRVVLEDAPERGEYKMLVFERAGPDER